MFGDRLSGRKHRYENLVTVPVSALVDQSHIASRSSYTVARWSRDLSAIFFSKEMDYIILLAARQA